MSLKGQNAYTITDNQNSLGRDFRLPLVLPILCITGISGYVFLVYRDETRRALLPNQVTSIDTLRALFVCVFPHALSMSLLQSASRRVYILDKSSGVFFELDDLK